MSTVRGDFLAFSLETKKEELNKGWSTDKKYIATTHDGKYLLRISSIDKKENREALYKTLIRLMY